MMDDKKIPKVAKEMAHNIIIENRSKISLSGVQDVESFDEAVIILHTDLDMLTVKGQDLHINKLNVDSGELVIEGEIMSVAYQDHGARNQGSLFSRIFK